MEQLTMDDIEIQEKQAKAKVIAAELDRRLKSVALAIDRHRLAAINDKSYSYFSEILNTNNEDGQKPFQVKYIPSLIIERPDVFIAEVIHFICDITGLEYPERKKRVTPEQELILLKRKIREHGLELLFEEKGK